MEHGNKLINYLLSLTSLSEEMAEVILEQSESKKLGKGETYCVKGQPQTKMGFLAEGILRIYDIDEAGNQWNKVLLTPPNLVLGNVNFLENTVHYIDALTDCELLEFPLNFLQKLMEEHPQFQLVQSKLLLNMFETKSERESDFLTLNAAERYEKFLLTHAHIKDQIPQFHIASYLGITPTQLSRIRFTHRNQQM